MRATDWTHSFGLQRAHIELYIHKLGDTGLMDLSIVAMMHGVCGFFRRTHRRANPSGPGGLCEAANDHHAESAPQVSTPLELIRFLQVARTLTVHHGALAHLLGINALRASEAAAVRIEDYREILRGHRVPHLIGTGNKPATMPITVPVLRVLEACRGEQTEGPLILRPASGNLIDRHDAYRMVVRIAKVAGIPRHVSAPTHCATPRSATPATRRPASRRADPGPPCRPTTTEHYDRARGNLDRHGVHFLTAYVVGSSRTTSGVSTQMDAPSGFAA